jgi:hypothetical protein
VGVGLNPFRNVPPESVAAYKIVHCAKRYIDVITEPGCTKKHDHETQEHGPQEELSGLICINILHNYRHINVLLL